MCLRCAVSAASLPRQLFVDDLLERGERLSPVQQTAVDEKRGGAGHASRLTVLEVGVDAGFHAMPIEALREPALIESGARCVRFQLLVRQPAGVREELLVIFPEPPLLLGARRRFGGGPRVRM